MRIILKKKSDSGTAFGAAMSGADTAAVSVTHYVISSSNGKATVGFLVPWELWSCLHDSRIYYPKLRQELIDL